MTYIFHAVLLIASFFSTDSLTSKICVNNFENNCIQCNVNVTLNESLQEYLDKINASTKKEIILCSTEIILQASIAINNTSFVSITSFSEFSAIFCTKNDSGISFVNATNATLKNIKIQGCGSFHHSAPFNRSAGESNLHFRTSLYFLSSTNIEIYGLTALENQGIGLTLINCNGSVVIESCKFEKNFADNGGNGLYIEFSHFTSERDSVAHKGSSNSHYSINNCTFNKNTANSAENLTKIYGDHFQGLGRGGGLCIHFRGSTRKNVVRILNCSFYGNEAMWGGGAVCLYVRDSAEDNEVKIDNSTFSDNVCTLNGGGGVDIVFLFNGSQQPKKNKIVFLNSVFLNNQAEHGGGAQVYSGYSSRQTLENIIKFTSCKWEENRAKFGAAINLGTHSRIALNKRFLPTPIFTDCSFVHNFVDTTLSFSYINSIEVRGIFAVIYMDLIFTGKTSFIQNNGTALYLVSSNATFKKSSYAVFQENRGKIGGAIVIEGLGTVKLNDNSNFSFISNEARQIGGAIYQASHSVLYDYVAASSCFIQYAGNKELSKRNIYIIFKKNKAATPYGNSIYVSTLKQCFASCLNQLNLNRTLNCIASFTFDGDASRQIATTNGSFEKKTSMMHAIPGGNLQLPLALHDEVGNEINVLYHVYLTITANTTNSTMSLSEEYISNKWVQVFGRPDDKALLQVKTVDIWEVSSALPITLLDCPPGFSLANRWHNGRNVSHCQCAATSNDILYSGIIDCNENSFVATMRQGFWYGYDKPDDSDTEFGKSSDLVSGYCPLRYCKLHDKSTVSLPNSTNISELDLLACGSRTGRLCASCRGNRSTLFHSNTFECFHSKSCPYGLLLYLLADILPITIFFIITIVFDINFTHGAINGLIFYFQVTDISIHITSGFVRCRSFSSRLQELYALLSGIFNLKFFYHKDMSFCLWYKFQTFNILAFRYVNILYALCLVIAIISTTRACSLKKIGRKLPKLLGKSFNVKTTIIQGLSGFLVICYSECSKISLLLLTPENLYYTNKTRKVVVLLNGELNYFKGRHLIYALPAVLFLIVMGFIPPLLFISYPLCYRIFALLRISESLVTKTLCRVFPLERLRPFFDSFQSSFKDEYRFYSGLFFLYRMITLLTFFATRSITTYLTVLLVEYSIILCLHAIIQPYKKRWHNIIDCCIFTNLIILIALTLVSFRRSLEYFNTNHTVEEICVVKTLFLCTPMVFFLIMIISKIVKKLKLVKIIFKPKAEGCRQQELSESLLFARRGSITNSMSHM